MRTIKHLIIVSLTLFFFSCKKDITNSNSPNTQHAKELNGRLTFDSYENFYAFIDDLDKGEKDISTDFPSLWQITNESVKLEDESEVSDEIQDLLKFDFPSSYLKVLNGKGEVKIGDEIIWYHGGKKYFIPASDEYKIDKIKLSPETIVKSCRAGADVIQVNIKNSSVNLNTSDRYYFPFGGALSAIHQHEFNQVYPPNGGPRKYVHEVITFFDGYWVGPSVYIWTTVISLRIKMEWKGSSGSWKPAGETRDVSVSLNGNAAVSNPGQGGYEIGPVILTSSSLQVNSDYYVPLAKFNGSGTLPGSTSWALDLWGTIYQHVVGDITANEWYNTGTSTSPLW